MTLSQARMIREGAAIASVAEQATERREEKKGDLLAKGTRPTMKALWESS